MGRGLLELEIRGRLMAADLVSGRLARAREERGQTTVEWIAVMVALITLVAVVAGADVWQQAGDLVVNAVNAIFGTNGDRV